MATAHCTVYTVQCTVYKHCWYLKPSPHSLLQVTNIAKDVFVVDEEQAAAEDVWRDRGREQGEAREEQGEAREGSREEQLLRECAMLQAQKEVCTPCTLTFCTLLIFRPL